MKQLDPIIAHEGQTTFAIPSGYTPSTLLVTVNGVIIPPGDFTATDGATVKLVTGLGDGDELGVLLFG